ncbi:MAG TPA: PIN domain-containing protein [Candidatus Thermoplasmatota archaeon]|nr:PIN domain-containing protein [Candidatus Thermoplasmatota archaeon]
MTVVLDTSLLIASINVDEPRHPEAQLLLRRILAGELGVPVTSDYVLDEGLTLLRRRPGRKEVSQDYASFFLGEADSPPPISLRTATRQEIEKAARLHFQHYERGLSFTDCILVVLAQDLGATVASFDEGFDGIVPRVPAKKGQA